MKPALFILPFAGLTLLGFVAGRSFEAPGKSRAAVTTPAPVAAQSLRPADQQPVTAPAVAAAPDLAAALHLHHPLARAAEVAGSIQRMSPREVEEAIADLLRAPPTEEGDRAMTPLWQRLGELTGKYAVEKALEHPRESFRFMSHALTGWAMRDPDTVWTWGLEQQAIHATAAQLTAEASLGRTALRAALNSSLESGQFDWVKARFFEIEDPALQRNMASMLGSAFGQRDPETLLALTEEVSTPQLRASLLSGFAMVLAEEDPREAATWALSLDAAEQSQVLGSVLMRWQHSEGPAAVSSWVLSQPPGQATDNALRNIFSGHARAGIEEVRAQLQGIPEGRRDPALAGAAMSLMQRNPAEAFTLAEQVQTSRDRQMLLRPIYTRWRGSDAAAAEAYVNSTPNLTPEEKAALLQPAPARPAP